jgi:chemotaxis methyl-accepting protein methylase
MLSRDDVGVLGDLDEVLARGGHLGIGHGESVARSDVPISNRRRGA